MPESYSAPACASTSNAKSAPAKQICKWLALLVEPDQVFEIRIPKYRPPSAKKASNPSRLFRGDQLEAAAKYALEMGKFAPGVYFTLNPLKDGLNPARAAK